jgi:plastocyanin
MKTIWIIVVLLVVLGCGWYFYGPALGIRYEKPNNSPPSDYNAIVKPSSTPTPTTVSGSTNPSPQNVPVKLMVEMTSAGFVPSTINIKKGTTVVFTNKDSVPHWPASSKHPTHFDYAGFDSMKGVLPGESYEFTFNEVKSIGMHDHLNPKLFGKVTVTE